MKQIQDIKTFHSIKMTSKNTLIRYLITSIEISSLGEHKIHQNDNNLTQSNMKTVSEKRAIKYTVQTITQG